MGLFKKTVSPERFGEMLFELARIRTVELKEAMEYKEDHDWFPTFIYPVVFNLWIFDTFLKKKLDEDTVSIISQFAYGSLLELMTKGLNDDDISIVLRYIGDASDFTEETMKTEFKDAFDNPIRTLIKQMQYETYDEEFAGEIEIMTAFQYYTNWITDSDNLIDKYKIK